ncbi:MULTISPECIES: universal stress protein [unclassified Ruegeria]|uniref:universal stress protein n=1 Tax=unclassified Ruegeria TaxID=2625375 RepID=UPI001ADD1C18|nr:MULTISPECIES: universal stress protein [unclassified Ruegeria]MBO9410885.1 universal stress protein [Ruegeria sp. R8_1]MBO9415086.1 universal stress protein [Ruegeria sp. R8_2]
MYSHIMFPVDLHLPPEVRKAADVAAEVAKWQAAKITVVSVTGTQPGDLVQTDATVNQELKAFAEQLSTKSGSEVAFRNIHSVDVAAEVDGDLARAAEEIGADLIVVGTHAPRITDYIFSSHAGYLANHAKMSVFVVR